MRNRNQITRMVIVWVMGDKFAAVMNARKNALSSNFRYKNPHIDEKANIYRKISGKAAKNIMEYIIIKSTNGFNDFLRTFNFLFTHWHMTIIPKNFIECK